MRKYQEAKGGGGGGGGLEGFRTERWEEAWSRREAEGRDWDGERNGRPGQTSGKGQEACWGLKQERAGRTSSGWEKRTETTWGVPGGQ